MRVAHRKSVGADQGSAYAFHLAEGLISRVAPPPPMQNRNLRTKIDEREALDGSSAICARMPKATPQTQPGGRRRRPNSQNPSVAIGNGWCCRIGTERPGPGGRCRICI